MSSARALFALATLALLACSGEGDATAAGPALEADIERLRLLMIDDPAQTPLAEVERVAVERPIEAARLLETGGIPAARRQLRAAETLHVRSDEGRRLKRRLVAAYRDRVTALVEYEDVLEGGSMEESRLLDVLRAQSAVELALMRVDGDMETLVPTAGPREGEAEGDDDEPGAGEPSAPGLGGPRR